MHVRLPVFLGLGLGAGRAWAFCSDEVRDELPMIEAGACCQALHTTTENYPCNGAMLLPYPRIPFTQARHGLVLDLVDLFRRLV